MESVIDQAFEVMSVAAPTLNMTGFMAISGSMCSEIVRAKKPQLPQIEFSQHHYSMLNTTHEHFRVANCVYSTLFI